MLLNEKSKGVFSPEIRFLFPWRKYQQRFLNNFDTYKQDRHLHVIAPPGAGKTILGLEMIRRVNKRTLVLSPTLTIKHQWKNRFDSFFDPNAVFEGISLSVKELKVLNFSTYQGLYALHKSMSSTTVFVNYFKEHGIEVLLLDEAHHLKKAWWSVLMELKNNSDLIIIALTATPPFDSSHSEMKKYYELCGPVDEEISIPELVKERALCPHQDYVYLSEPEKDEVQYIFEYRQKIATFVQFLKENKKFVHLLESHPYYLLEAEFLDDVYKYPNYFASILIFLHHCNVTISSEKLAFFGFEKEDEIQFPKLTLAWVEILLQHLLISNRGQLLEDELLLSTLEKTLRKIGGLSRNNVQLLGNNRVFKNLTHSRNKLVSIKNIVRFEQEQLGKELRLVVLTDFIRKEFLGLNSDYTNRVDKMGVVPIFHYLKNSTIDCSKLAVLSGTLVIVNCSLLGLLKKELSLKDVQINRIENDTDFVQINVSQKVKNNLVAVLTSFFELGHISILIGTKSLLGEGWDAPAINALIMASNVGSFVTSNQMRGRAIRVKGEGKTSCIWHLASVDLTDVTGGHDVQQLERRFNTFVGVDTRSNTISSGIGRLGMPSEFPSDFNVNSYNDALFEKAKNRDLLSEQWRKSSVKGTRLRREINSSFLDFKIHKKNKSKAVTDMVKIMLSELSIGLLFFTIEFVLNNFLAVFSGGFVTVLKLFLGGLFVFLIPKTYKLVKACFLFGNTHKLLKKIAHTILLTMEDLQLFTSPVSKLYIDFEKVNKGEVSCSLQGATYRENAIFVMALNQVLMPIQSPKYLIHRHSWLGHKIGMFNVHAVPDVFEKKTDANVFFKYWLKNIGKSELVFGRRHEGRKLIVKSRLFQIRYAESPLSRDLVVWK